MKRNKKIGEKKVTELLFWALYYFACILTVIAISGMAGFAYDTIARIINSKALGLGYFFAGVVAYLLTNWFEVYTKYLMGELK